MQLRNICMIWGMSSSRTSAWKRCIYTDQIGSVCMLESKNSLQNQLVQWLDGIALIQAAVYRNRLSHGCSFWVIAAWCLSACVRSFDWGSYYTFFDQLGMDFLFSVYVFWVCVSHVSIPAAAEQQFAGCPLWHPAIGSTSAAAWHQHSNSLSSSMQVAILQQQRSESPCNLSPVWSSPACSNPVTNGFWEQLSSTRSAGTLRTFTW